MERFNAADILRGLAADAESAIGIIIETMRNDENDNVRAQCAFAMHDIGAAVKDRAAFAVPSLIETLLTDKDGETRALAATALARIGASTEIAAPALQQALQDEHEWVCEAAKEALDELC